jgi:Xaa-Pro aminopeptidase
VSDVLIIGDTYRSPELRHELPLGVPDPITYLERDGERHVFCPSMEAERIEALGLAIAVHSHEEIGLDLFVREGLDRQAMRLRLAVNACRHAGLARAVVPHTFPAGHLVTLRESGVDLSVDQELFDLRRRGKNELELAGIRRAQRAADAGMRTVADMLAAASPGRGSLLLEGEELTVERVKAAVAAAFEEQGCVSDDFIVAPGAQGAVGHHMGSGPIALGEPVVVDLWPRDRESACFADMTRTFVAGEPSTEIREYHRLAREALDRTTARVRAGMDCRALFDAACDVFEAAGHPTLRTKAEGEVLADGFFHGLGHGVGLEVHESPYMTNIPAGELVAGDVITLEPGLYRRGYGGVRVEDLVLVAADGHEVLTGFSYDLEVAST